MRGRHRLFSLRYQVFQRLHGLSLRTGYLVFDRVHGVFHSLLTLLHQVFGLLLGHLGCVLYPFLDIGYTLVGRVQHFLACGFCIFGQLLCALLDFIGYAFGLVYRLVAASIARIPVALTNALYSLYLAPRKSRPYALQMYDLVHCGHAGVVTRRVARLRGIR